MDEDNHFIAGKPVVICRDLICPPVRVCYDIFETSVPDT